MIKLENVTFGYGLHRSVLRDFSLTVEEGERVWLCGPSGQGKTTVLRLLLGLERPRRGTVYVPAGTRFSAVFQEDRLLDWKTAEENTALFSDAASAGVMLARLGLGEVCGEYPAALSGGMKRRAALARALCHPFDVLVLDEPLTGLDDAAKAVCLKAVDQAVGHRTLVLVSHDAAEAEALGARRINLPEGRRD